MSLIDRLFRGGRMDQPPQEERQPQLSPKEIELKSFLSRHIEEIEWLGSLANDTKLQDRFLRGDTSYFLDKNNNLTRGFSRFLYFLIEFYNKYENFLTRDSYDTLAIPRLALEIIKNISETKDPQKLVTYLQDNYFGDRAKRIIFLNALGSIYDRIRNLMSKYGINLPATQHPSE
jgi:hypothetical protein